MAQIVDALISSNSEAQREFSSGTMKIAGGVIEFKDREGKVSKVYKISNISALLLIERETPWLLIMLMLLSISVCFYLPPLALIGIPGFLILLVRLIKYYLFTDKYTLALVLNAGLNASTYIVSLDVDFLRQIAEVIRDIMSGEARGANYLINVDNRKISKINKIDMHGDVKDSTFSVGDNNRFGPDEADEETEFDETGS